MKSSLKPLTALKRKPKTLVELFRDPRRWTKGQLINGDYTAVCVRGGINFLCTGNADNFAGELFAIEDKIRAAAGLVDEDRMAVVCWNNDPSLTHKEFLRVLKKAGV